MPNLSFSIPSHWQHVLSSTPLQARVLLASGKLIGCFGVHITCLGSAIDAMVFLCDGCMGIMAASRVGVTCSQGLHVSAISFVLGFSYLCLLSILFDATIPSREHHSC